MPADLPAWQACNVPTKGAGRNTAGCVVQIFKQGGDHQWRMIFDETVDQQFSCALRRKVISI
jgi:hypothetical protein